MWFFICNITNSGEVIKNKIVKKLFTFIEYLCKTFLKSVVQMKPNQSYLYLLLFFCINCITFYEKIPNPSKQIIDLKPKTSLSSASQKSFFYENSFSLQPGQKIGSLLYDPNSDFFKIGIEEKRKYKSNNSPFLCLLSILTITLIPCYYDAVETVRLSVTSPYFFDKRKPIEQDIRKREYAWLPLILISPFFGDKSPEDGNRLALEEAEGKLSKEYDTMLSEIDVTKKKLKPLIENPQKYSVILNDFATIDFYAQKNNFSFGTGKDVIIQIFNNSFKTMTKIKYHLTSTNSLTKSPNDVYEIVENEEIVFPASFSKNILFANRNPRPNSLFLFMDKIEIEWEDGSKTVIAKSEVNQIKVVASPRLIADLFKQK
ncbi:hypothetical protein LEP1GSC202_3799 [Leptospira yanagawae serovar Saopaulo str. Sao Paulo = ATCC 700523]|uniref:Uncharacterized protein n=2 Tax=Leptospira yanagawae TaxID=293069 RepID=A0A5E8HHK8_9LEPT|nr:hypothetical protein LEP1GSC202_3799 [Leptospira yanagawae serovar Saopaulo str. Sao Paulo = ATCC 700523]